MQQRATDQAQHKRTIGGEVVITNHRFRFENDVMFFLIASLGEGAVGAEQRYSFTARSADGSKVVTVPGYNVVEMLARHASLVEDAKAEMVAR